MSSPDPTPVEPPALALPTQALTDDVVVLRPPTEGDAEAVYALCQDPEIQRWTTVPSPYELEHAKSFVAEIIPRGWQDGTAPTWGVCTDGELVGMIGLTQAGTGSAEVGYWLGPQARGTGIMRRAVLLAVGYGFEAMGLERITWEAYVGNEASWAVAWRAGFRFEGLRRANTLQRGARRDAWVASLLADDPREPAAPWPGLVPVAPEHLPGGGWSA